MSDIVERLRRTLSDLPGNDDDLFNEIHEQREEAADEIERLHAREARLREALDYYAKNHYPNLDNGPWGANSNDFGDVARAALGEEKKG
jgi:hypothetical protein